MSSKQTTLFQTWGYEGNSYLSQPKSSQPPKKSPAETAFLQVQNDEDDALLAEALEKSLHEASRDPVNFEELPAIPNTQATEQIPGFDLTSGRTWIYPTNYPVRTYQYDIVQSSLFDNTLVSLPTGLGKTFIAAVVMYNFYRWYPRGKVVFMAPTKPLVTQQIEACYNIMGIPQDETSVMTGNVAVSTRAKAWQQKRVFFMTPQVMSNDLARGLFPASEVKLLVVDEAHRAQGDYAYCQVVKELQKSRASFRVVALSATPGSDLQAVRMMLQNLLISRIELRNEDSPDIVPYTFKRKIDKIVVPISGELKAMKEKFLTILEIFIKRLAKVNALSRRGNSTNPLHYTKFGILQSRDEFRQNPPGRLDNHQKGVVEGDFSSAMTLYHAYDLLVLHGLRSFYNFMAKSAGETSDSPNTTNTSLGGGAGGSSSPATSTYVNRRLKYDLNRMPMWSEIMTELKEKFSGDFSNIRLGSKGPQLLSQFGAASKSQGSIEKEMPLGHPKLEKLRDVVTAHFEAKKEIETRVMIFSQYRDSVQEIAALLHQYRPLVKVMEFVGQSGTAGKKGLTQKEQIEVVRRFREGGYNTLVATCVGEEGLDIGDVDLIVCYDVSKSPIRLVQRMGRTGRKREGRIIVLVAEGKEEQNYNQSMYCKNSINKAILEKHKLVNFLTLAPRMVPKGIDPVCHKMVMKVGTFVSAKSGKSNIGPEKNKKITSMMKKGVDKVTSYRKSCGYLTDAEYEEFAKMYPNCEDLFANVPKIPKRKELWAWSKGDILENIIEQNDQRKVEKNEYSFADWNLWQNSISSRFLVSQSSKSKIFCEILRKEEPPVQDEQIVPVIEDLADEDNDDEITFLNCSLVQVQPMETEEDEEVVFVPIESDANTEVPERQNIFGDLLEDDPANKLYGTDEYFNRVTDKIDRMIKALENRTIPKFDVTEALCNFRKTKRNQNRAMDLDRRSPSPVYLSQAEVLEKSQETSTPMAPCSSKTMIPKSVDPITPVTRRSKRHASLNNCSAFDDSFVQVSDIQDESKRLSSIATPKSSQIRSKSLFSNDDKENAVEGKRISQNNSAFNDSFVSLSTIQDKLDNPETSQKVGNISFYNESQLASMLEPSQCLKNLSDEHQVSKNNVDIIEEIKQEKTEHFTHEEPISDYGSEHDQNNDEEIVAELDLRNFCDFDEFCENLVKLQTVTRKVTPESVKSVKSQKVKQETPESVKSQMVRRKESPECEAILRQIEIKVEKHFKMPNLQDFESRARVTPKALKFTQSPVIPIKAKKRAIISSSDEENSADEALNSDKDDSPIIRKPKLKKPRNKFIDDEAELSGDGSEDDEHSNENLDTYDQSFLDDDGDHGIPDLDEKAIYLRSIKSPELNFRKLKPLKPMAKEDIYSQEVTDSMMLDDYQEDSFCVENSDEIEYADSPDELDFVPEFEEGEKPKKNKTLAVAKKRKRILMSSSDEEEVRIVTPPAVSKVSMTIATPPAVSKVSVSSVSSLSTPKNVSSATSKSVLSFQASPGSVSISAQDKSVTSVTTKNSVTPSKLQKSKVVPGVPQCGVTIVANPTEVHKSHDLISSLKHIHGLTVCVQKGFDSAGYLLSTRLAVSLVKNSDLCNGAQRHKLVQIVQTLNEYYERGFLIIETSNSNQFLEMRHNRSKYIDMIICQLATSNIRILYSQTIEQTSGLIAKLAKKEARKHFALPANLKLPELSEDFVPMYQEIPGVSLALAMRMCISFENPSELFSAALATLIRKLKIDEKRAQKIHEFCRHELKIDNVSDGEDDSE